MKDNNKEYTIETGTKSDAAGKLYGIGVGPGNPKLLTLQALEVIGSCDLIVLPAKSAEECIAYQIVEQVFPEISRMPLLCMPFPMTRDKQALESAHGKIYGEIRKQLLQGKTVGMLTIGDPSIYSTYLYIHKRAAADGLTAQMISGIPSFCAAAARLGMPLGENAEEIHIIPAAYDVADTLSYSGTCIYMKSGKKLKELLEILREETGSRSLEICGISNCGMENEKVYHGLEELELAKGYLTIVFVKRQPVA